MKIYYTPEDLLEIIDANGGVALSRANVLQLIQAQQTLLTLDLVDFKCDEDDGTPETVSIVNSAYTRPNSNAVSRPLDFDRRFDRGQRLKHIKSGTILQVNTAIENERYGGIIHTILKLETNIDRFVRFDINDVFEIL